MGDHSGDVSKQMQAEEEKARLQREKQDEKTAKRMAKERQNDLDEGKELLDKKFQQLEFLMNKSKVSPSKSLCERMRPTRC